MRNVHPIRAAVIAAFMLLTAQWFFRREKSLMGKLMAALGR